MDLTNLTLVTGLSRKVIEAKLKEENIVYLIKESDRDPYFKSSIIDIARMYPLFSDKKQLINLREEHKHKVTKLLGFPNFFKNNDYFYQARYKIEKNFDISNINGKITFDRGLLIESTRIIF